MSSLTRSLVLLVASATLLSACGTANPYEGMTADQIYERAVQEFEQGEYDDAIRALDRLFASYAGFERAEEARLMMARAYFAKGDYLLARADFQRFQDRYPTSPRAAEAALGVCRSLAELSPIPQRDQEFTYQALDTCRNVSVDYAGTPEADEAGELAGAMRVKLAEKEYLNGEFYYRRELYDSAIKYWEFVLDLYPDTEWAPRALKGIYDANVAIGYEDLAEEARQRLLEEYPESAAADEVRADGAPEAGDAVG